MPMILLYLAMVSLMVANLPAAAADAQASYAIYETDTDFETVMEGAKMAIQERGMYINNVMHLDEMLERTGKDLGVEETAYRKAQSIEFCSSVLLRKMASDDPGLIVNCPFTLSIYVLPEQPDKTYVAHRRFAQEEIESSAAMAEISEMLKGVAEGAISW